MTLRIWFPFTISFFVEYTINRCSIPYKNYGIILIGDLTQSYDSEWVDCIIIRIYRAVFSTLQIWIWLIPTDKYGLGISYVEIYACNLIRKIFLCHQRIGIPAIDWFIHSFIHPHLYYFERNTQPYKQTFVISLLTKVCTNMIIYFSYISSQGRVNQLLNEK